MPVYECGVICVFMSAAVSPVLVGPIIEPLVFILFDLFLKQRILSRIKLLK